MNTTSRHATTSALLFLAIALAIIAGYFAAIHPKGGASYSAVMCPYTTSGPCQQWRNQGA